MQIRMTPRMIRQALACLTLGAATALTALVPGSLLAQNPDGRPIVGPSVRLTSPVVNTELVTLKGNVHPLAQPQFDRGALPSSTQTGRMALLLRRSDEQQTALHRYLDDLQNPASPSYRKWLTPEALGKTYGVSDTDLATVKGWLESQGFRVEKVSAARTVILFSGTVGAVQTAFHTSIHSFVAGGETHAANVTDPQIPKALAPVVAGIAPMNDFRAKPAHHMGPAGAWDAETKRIRPQLTLTDSNKNNYLYVDPADAATIYNTPNQNLNRNYTPPNNWDGSGITIGVVGYSNLQLSDVQNYRTTFLNDADPSHLPKVIVDGNDPGVLADGTGVEALLDAEISSGIAPGANVNFYAASTTILQDGLSLAILRALDDNAVSILSVSYGNCEQALGAGGNLQFSQFWEQAASQGITVTVSTGDSGSAGCDNPNNVTSAVGGLAVSGIASTPYNIAVGGTDFSVLGNGFTGYVSTTDSGAAPYYGTALGFIPETPWNDSAVSNGALAQNTAFKDSKGNTNIVAGSGGKSSLAYCSVVNNSNGSCPGTLSGYPKPAFQSSLTPNDGVRDLPDVSFFAANGAYNAIWVLCSDSVTSGVTSQSYTNCLTSNGTFTNTTSFDGVGGTSASTPAFAGMLALVAQSQGGIRLGQANNVIYNLAANHYGAIFHDTVVGNNSVACTSGSPNCASNGFLTGYDTATGYDYATGLGSMDITQLVTNWATAAFTSTGTTLAVGTSANNESTGNVSVPHGTNLFFHVGVTPSAATGDVSVTNTSGTANGAASFADSNPLTNGAVDYTSFDLPGGTYTISAYYDGDATHAPSTSSPSINVNISAESSTTSLNLDILDPAQNTTVTGSTMGYGFYAFADAQPYGNSSPVSGSTIFPNGVPTGTVALQNGGASFATVALNSIGAAEYPLYNQAPGSYTLQALYSGDNSFNASTSGTVPLTIVKGATAVALNSSATTIAAGGSLTVVVTLQTDSVGAYPSGGVTLTGNGVSFAANQTLSGTLNDGTVATATTFTVAASQLASGANTLTASYQGDGNYNGSTGTTSITLSGAGGGSAAFSLAGPTGGISVTAPGQSGTGTVTISPTNGFTGAVSLSCSVAAASSGVTPSCSIPQTATITGTTPATATLTIGTTASTASNSMPLRRFFSGGGEIALGCLLLLAMPARRRSWRGMLALLLLIVGVGAIGCGGSSSSHGVTGTPVGSYTVTVTGTSGTVTANTQVTVNVQ